MFIMMNLSGEVDLDEEDDNLGSTVEHEVPVSLTEDDYDEDEEEVEPVPQLSKKEVT